MSIFSTGVEKINLTSGGKLRIKLRNSFNFLNIFSGVKKGTSLVPICSSISLGCFIRDGTKQYFILAILVPGK